MSLVKYGQEDQTLNGLNFFNKVWSTLYVL
jgi:hypothetical protein